MVLGGLPLLYIFAFAGMAPPTLQGWDYWSRVLPIMFDFAGSGWITVFSLLVFLFGAGVFLLGVWATVASAIPWLIRRRS